MLFSYSFSKKNLYSTVLSPPRTICHLHLVLCKLTTLSALHVEHNIVCLLILKRSQMSRLLKSNDHLKSRYAEFSFRCGLYYHWYSSNYYSIPSFQNSKTFLTIPWFLIFVRSRALKRYFVDHICAHFHPKGFYTCINTLRTGLLNCLNARSRGLNFRHRASCI